MPELITLDSNFLIAAVRNRTAASRQLEDWMTHGQIVRISSVAWSEFLCGPVEESDKEIARTLLADIEPFTAADAELASEFFNVTGRRSRSHIDCMIAAHAVRRNAELATLNIKRFRRFPKLRLATNSGLSAK